MNLTQAIDYMWTQPSKDRMRSKNYSKRGSVSSLFYHSNKYEGREFRERISKIDLSVPTYQRFYFYIANDKSNILNIEERVGMVAQLVHILHPKWVQSFVEKFGDNITAEHMLTLRGVEF